MTKTVFYVLPWVLGTIWILVAVLMNRRLERAERWILLLTVFPLLGNLIIPAFLGVGIHDYRYYHLITAATALPASVWMAIEFTKRVKARTLRLPKLYFYELALLAMIPIGLFSQVYGWLIGNSPKYLLSDAYKWFIFPLFYFFLVYVLRTDRIRRILGAFYGIQIQLVLISCVFILWTLVIGDVRKTHVFGAEIVLPLLLVANFSLDGFRRMKLDHSPRNRFQVFVLLAVTSVGIYLSIERTFWMTLLPALFIAALLLVPWLPWRRWKRTGGGPLFTFVLNLIILFGVSGIHSGFLSKATLAANGRAQAGFDEIIRTGPGLLRGNVKIRGSEAVPPADAKVKPEPEKPKPGEVEIDKDRLGSLDRRILEVSDGWNYMKSAQSWWKYLIGFGDGAQYKVERGFESSSATGETTGWNHTFHFTLMGTFFLKGALGLTAVLTFLAGLFFASYKAAIRKIKSDPDGSSEIFISFFITGIVSFFYYFGGGSMLYDMPFILYTVLFGLFLRGKGLPQEAERTISHEDSQPRLV